MTTLVDKSLLSGGDNKPPMLEKHLYDSWKSRMELYMLNRPHGRMILASVEKGPLVWPSITVDGATRLKEYIEPTAAEAIQADCDIKAINIILQGLPTEIYALVSQHLVAKDLWEKIKLLMQGTSLTKQERECKLYVVPTGRVVVPTGRYVVPAGKVIIIVSPGRLSLVPTSRILSPGRVKYLKRTGRDYDGRVIILPPMTANKHIAVQRESKARTTLLQSIPDDHVADFHYMDDAGNIISEAEGLHKGNRNAEDLSPQTTRPIPVPTGRQNRPIPVPTGRQNRPIPVPTGRGDSPSVTSGWWQSTARPMPHLNRPTSSYFQTYTPYVPQMYYNHMQYGGVRWATAVKPSAGCSWKTHRKGLYWENSYTDAEDEGIFDSGCSRSMTGNMERLDDFQEFQGGKVTFGGGEGRITGKGTIRTPTLDFENVYYVKELQQFNLFSISQICDKKNRVLFTDTDCLVLSKDFKLPDESMVLLRVPRKHNLYTINLNNLSPKGNLACLMAKASVDESVQWHRRMGHVNYKNMNRTVINLVENELNKKVKAIRYDNGTEFKNALIIELYGSKGIKRDYSNARTPQQNRTKAVRTACYVLNRVLVTSPPNKIPYALLIGNIPSVSHFKPFGCYVTILNTSDHLGKFDGKADEGYIVGYSTSNKAYRVYNVPNKRVEETMNLRYLEEKPNVQGLGHEWYFDLDYLTDTLGYNRDKANQSAGTQEASTNPAGTQDANSDSECDEQVIIVPSYPLHRIQEAEPKDTFGDEVDDSPLDSTEEIFQQELARLKCQEQRATSDSTDVEELQKRACTKIVPTGSIPVPTGSIPVPSSDTTISPGGVPVPTGSPTDSFFDDEPTTRFPIPSDLRNNEPSPGIFSFSSYDDEFGVDLKNLASIVEVSPVATKRINTIHPQSLIIRDHTSAMQIRSKVNNTTTVEPRSVAQALEDPSWVDAMQEEIDARGIVVRNKARLVAQGHRQEEGIDYDEVFAPVTRIEAIILFLAFASYMGFMVFQIDVKSAFLYGSINEEIYVTQPKGFLDPQHPKKVTSLARTDEIFIGQDKYVQEILKKFDLECSVLVVRNQVHLLLQIWKAVEEDFEVFLKATYGLALWYPKESPFVLEAFIVTLFVVTPSSHVKDARKGKGVAVEEPTPTQDKTFKQLEEERLGWEATKRLQAQELADLEKQRAESLMQDAHLARRMVDFSDDDFAAKMVALNQGLAVYTTGWTMAQVQKLSPEQLQEEFDKIQRAIAFTRGLKRDGSPMTNEVKVEAPSQDVSREKVAAPSHSQNIPEAQVEVPSQEATVEDVEVPSNITSKAQQTVSSLKKVGTKKKLLGRKGIHTSQSTIPIEEGDLDAEHKLCIKYASDEDSASDCDTPISFILLSCIGVMLLGFLMDSAEVNDGSDFWKNQHTWSIQNWKLYSFSGVHVLETVSGPGYTYVCGKEVSFFSINLIEKMPRSSARELSRNVRYMDLTHCGSVDLPVSRNKFDSKRLEVMNGYS
ncbi:putative ribonuclease H-like domain-containing protein [Tanacetum coccineum]